MSHDADLGLVAEDLHLLSILRTSLRDRFPEAHVFLEFQVYENEHEDFSLPYLSLSLDGREVYRSTGPTLRRAMRNISVWSRRLEGGA